MTVSVRPWEEIAADLREWADGCDDPEFPDETPIHREAAVAGDALAAEVARLTDLNERIAAVDDVAKAYQRVYFEDFPVVADLQRQLIELRFERAALAAVVAAVHTALDQYDADRYHVGGMAAAAPACVSAIAKAVRR